MNAVTETGSKVGVASACQALGLPRATYYRHLHPKPSKGPVRRPPPRALPPEERQQVLAVFNEPRFMDANRWRSTDGQNPVTIWTASDLELTPEWIGAAGSPTSVAGLREVGQGDRARRHEFISGTPEEEAHVLYERISEFLRGKRHAV